MSMSVCLSVCPFVCLRVCLSARIILKSHSRTSPIFVPVARSSSNGVAIRYVLPVLRMTSCFHTMGPMNERAWRCLVRQMTVLVGLDASRARAAAAHWLAGSKNKLAGAADGESTGPGVPVAVLAVGRLDSGDDGARFAVCLMLVSCALGGGEVCCL